PSLPRTSAPGTAAGRPPLRAVTGRRETDELYDFARVHYVGRVQRGLDGTHELELGGAPVLRQVCPLGNPDTVLGADAAAQRHGRIIDDCGDFLALGEEPFRRPSFRLADVEMDVAVAHVAEGHRPGLGEVRPQRGTRLLDQIP